MTFASIINQGLHMTSLFNQLETQLTEAIKNLIELNRLITSMSTNLSKHQVAKNLGNDSINLSTVRKLIQDVSIKLDGESHKISEAMQNEFNKNKLKEFTPDEYPKLIQIIERLVSH